MTIENNLKNINMENPDNLKWKSYEPEKQSFIKLYNYGTIKN